MGSDLNRGIVRPSEVVASRGSHGSAGTRLASRRMSWSAAKKMFDGLMSVENPDSVPSKGGRGGETDRSGGRLVRGG